MTRDTFPFLSVMASSECRGFVLSRGPKGYEAVTGGSGEISLGTFADKDAAIAAIMQLRVGSSD
jgi:hypothetical protein